MSFEFWGYLLLMLAIAVAILIVPMLRVKPSRSLAYRDSNLALYRSRIAELKDDLEGGRIDREHYETAASELDRDLLNDIPEESIESADLNYGKRAERSPVTALLVAVFLPAFALIVYMELGMHSTVTEEVSATSTEPDIGEMVQALADKLQQQGGTVEEWAMLGRAYKHVRQYESSSAAFARAIELEPSARLYLEQSEALALANGQSFVGEPRELVMKAAELEPDNLNVIWFAGVAEFQSGNYGESIDHLVRLAEEAAQDPEIDESIRFYLRQAREQLVAQGVDVPSVDSLLHVEGVVQQPAASAVSLNVRVEIEPGVRELFPADAAVFVYAKAQQGPKMPLAAQRLRVSDLPIDVVLDDSMAMIDGMNLSAIASVVVSARVSTTGSAIAQPGDYIGEVRVDDVGAAGKLRITIGDEI